MAVSRTYMCVHVHVHVLCVHTQAHAYVDMRTSSTQAHPVGVPSSFH